MCSAHAQHRDVELAPGVGKVSTVVAAPYEAVGDDLGEHLDREDDQVDLNTRAVHIWCTFGACTCGARAVVHVRGTCGICVVNMIRPQW